MTGYFVTATGTDIGKTYVTAGLVKALSAKAIKPIVSGFDGGGDAAALLEAMGEAPTLENIARMSAWRFAAPLSPDMAAARENRFIDFAELVTFTRQSVKDGLVFVEGVGGVMVPLTATHTTLDWMTALDLPTILVTGNYLGAMSHTLSALDVLARRKLETRVVIVNESASSTVPLNETADTLSRYVDGLPIVCIPRLQEPTHPAFEELARLLQV